MKKIMTAIWWMLFCGTAISQTTATLTSDSLSQNRSALSVSLSHELESLDSIRIILFEKRGADTLLITEFFFSMTDNDPSEFYSFSRDAENCLFGLGLFDAGLYHCELHLKREGEWEITTLN